MVSVRTATGGTLHPGYDPLPDAGCCAGDVLILQDAVVDELLYPLDKNSRKRPVFLL